MAGVMPQQMVRPATPLALGIRVGAAHEIRLHVHLLNLEFARTNLVVDPLMAGIEPPHVVHHGHDVGLRLHAHQLLGVGQVVRHRDLDEHMLAGPHHLQCLGGVNGCRRSQNGRFDARLAQGLIEVERHVRDASCAGNRLGRLAHPAADRNDVETVDSLDGVEVLVREGALTNHADLQSTCPRTRYAEVNPQNGNSELDRTTRIEPRRLRIADHSDNVVARRD